MKDMGIVTGNGEQAKALVIGKNKVYVHTDITPITTDARGNEVTDLYQYHEIQYDKDEYIEIIAKQNEELNSELTHTQFALCELYEATL